MSITGTLSELQSIKQEIERLSRQLKTLRERKKTLESDVSTFIEEQDKPGIKYKGTQFLPQTKRKVDRKRTAKIKEEDASKVLQKYGITAQNSQALVKELLEAMRGPRTEETSLLIKKIK